MLKWRYKGKRSGPPMEVVFGAMQTAPLEERMKPSEIHEFVWYDDQGATLHKIRSKDDDTERPVQGPEGLESHDSVFLPENASGSQIQEAIEKKRPELLKTLGLKA